MNKRSLLVFAIVSLCCLPLGLAALVGALAVNPLAQGSEPATGSGEYFAAVTQRAEGASKS